MRNNYSPLPCAQAAACLGSWDSASAWPPCRASSFRLQGPGCGGEAQSGYGCLFWGSLWAFETRSIRFRIPGFVYSQNPTKQHSKVTMRISYSHPLPLRWKPPWCYFKIHLAIWKTLKGHLNIELWWRAWWLSWLFAKSLSMTAGSLAILSPKTWAVVLCCN